MIAAFDPDNKLEHFTSLIRLLRLLHLTKVKHFFNRGEKELHQSVCTTIASVHVH